MKTNTTPAKNKQTVWYQLFLFMAALLDLVFNTELFASVLGSTDSNLYVMASTVISVGLSFTKPINPEHVERLNKLEDEHENEAI